MHDALETREHRPPVSGTERYGRVFVIRRMEAGVSSRKESLDSINATLARIQRLSTSRSMFAVQAATANVVLTQPSYALLRAAIDEGPAPVKVLAGKAHMDVGMATRQLKILVDVGFVATEPDPRDRRFLLVSATPEGRSAARSLRDVRRRHLERALSAWSVADLDELPAITGPLASHWRDRQPRIV
jgi:DNA-binding MarR family transcriptional regulator